MDEWTISIVSYGNGYCEFKATCGSRSFLASTLGELKEKISEATRG